MQKKNGSRKNRRRQRGGEGDENPTSSTQIDGSTPTDVSTSQVDNKQSVQQTGQQPEKKDGIFSRVADFFKPAPPGTNTPATKNTVEVDEKGDKVKKVNEEDESDTEDEMDTETESSTDPLVMNDVNDASSKELPPKSKKHRHTCKIDAYRKLKRQYIRCVKRLQRLKAKMNATQRFKRKRTKETQRNNF